MPNQFRQTELEDWYVPEPNTGCWIFLGLIHTLGYGRIRRKGKIWQAHRLYYEAAKGPIPEDLEIDHLCRNHWCVNPEHLEAVTPGENQRRGMQTKLTWGKVAQIRKRAAEGERQRSLSREFVISESVVSEIVSGKRWSTP